MSEGRVVLRAEGLTKVYPAVKGGSRRGELTLFRELDLEVRAGEMVAVVGESGAGKSSLLHLLAALDRPTAGEVWCGEERLSGFSSKQASTFRNRQVGYVWQFHYLLPEFTAAENVAMPLLAGGMRRGDARERARRWLGEVGLGDRAENRAGGGGGGGGGGVERRRAAEGEPGAGAGDGAEDPAGGRADGGSGCADGRGGVWVDPAAARRARAGERAGDA